MLQHHAHEVWIARANGAGTLEFITQGERGGQHAVGQNLRTQGVELCDARFVVGESFEIFNDGLSANFFQTLGGPLPIGLCGQHHHQSAVRITEDGGVHL